MPKFHLPLAIVVVATASVPAFGISPGIPVSHGTTAIGVEGFVPVVCHARVTAESVSSNAGLTDLGQLREFCNSPGGYRVYADHSASLAHATLIVDGVSIPLRTDGVTVISSSNRAAINARTIALELHENTEGGSISFRIEPL